MVTHTRNHIAPAYGLARTLHLLTFVGQSRITQGHRLYSRWWDKLLGAEEM